MKYHPYESYHCELLCLFHQNDDHSLSYDS